jgi:hypothetical protein
LNRFATAGIGWAVPIDVTKLQCRPCYLQLQSRKLPSKIR